jgi:TPR repeat protein
LLTEQGIGVQRDIKTAAFWWTQAAAKGYDPAKYCLGHHYTNSKSKSAQAPQAHERKVELPNTIPTKPSKEDPHSDEELEGIEDVKR